MPSVPRWIDSVVKALGLPENKGQNVFQMATVDASGKPKVRTLVHRELFQPSGRPNLPVILTTTDVRSPKVQELRANPYAELCWWMEGSKDQFRISGPVRVIPSPHADRTAWVKGEPSVAFDVVEEQGFDWEKKRSEVFDNMSAHMKASWCRPPPGSVLQSYQEAKKWTGKVPKLGEAESEDDRRNQEQALQNFALVLIEAVEVDWVQLGEQPNRRTRFLRVGEEWTEEISVP
ncbi:hypothetical protein WOLCODRAFT_135682 [Wolfiporia cocos MD-104 SS10]|uniref:Pyridoxamine 5'-phosphate oxidase Alr4036 family FMN-binding domain-containing protein n=1 Tax=Wolfiporia cocos (strain MD-104) TaxID=742152 RepID=A0A2H3IY65_WOLCO|nr:hypothetical protein WOLCODRAFT_135682 [Wolfiporia cocos MD-104 SS10]